MMMSPVVIRTGMGTSRRVEWEGACVVTCDIYFSEAFGDRTCGFGISAMFVSIFTWRVVDLEGKHDVIWSARSDSSRFVFPILSQPKHLS
jgi:hypothetical protein